MLLDDHMEQTVELRRMIGVASSLVGRSSSPQAAKALVRGLMQLEFELNTHSHQENQILFPAIKSLFDRAFSSSASE